MSWGEPAAYNHVVSLVYAQKDGSDPGNVYYIRSTDSGVTFSAPFMLNTNTDVTKAQWQPNLSVSDAGTLFATWYDERSGGNCTVGGNTPCYQMWSRKSNDNGQTWLPDDSLSDVVSPLPAQPDPGIQPLYVGDYDYGSAILTKHVTSWDDGRVTISTQSQQDAFFDQETSGGGGENIVLTGSAQTQGTKSKVTLKWSPAENDGNIDVKRDGVVVQTTADDGRTDDKLRNASGQTHTYQVCENDGGGCSNTINVVIP